MPALKNLELFDDADFRPPENFYDDYTGKEALKIQILTVKDHMDVRMDFKIPCDTCDTMPDLQPGIRHGFARTYPHKQGEEWPSLTGHFHIRFFPGQTAPAGVYR